MITIIEIPFFEFAKYQFISLLFLLETKHYFENIAAQFSWRRKETLMGLQKLEEKLKPVQLDIVLSLVVYWIVASWRIGEIVLQALEMTEAPKTRLLL